MRRWCRILPGFLAAWVAQGYGLGGAEMAVASAFPMFAESEAFLELADSAVQQQWNRERRQDLKIIAIPVGGSGRQDGKGQRDDRAVWRSLRDRAAKEGVSMSLGEVAEFPWPDGGLPTIAQDSWVRYLTIREESANSSGATGGASGGASGPHSGAGRAAVYYFVVGHHVQVIYGLGRNPPPPVRIEHDWIYLIKSEPDRHNMTQLSFFVTDSRGERYHGTCRWVIYEEGEAELTWGGLGTKPSKEDQQAFAKLKAFWIQNAQKAKPQKMDPSFRWW